MDKYKSNILSVGLFRGIIFQILGLLLGMGVLSLIRLLLGVPAWKSEPAWVFGGFLGVFGFMIGVGAFTDWFESAKGKPIPDHHDWDPDKPRWLRYFSFSLDHKVIGIQYFVTSVLLLGLAGTFALIFRTELAAAGLQVVELKYVQYFDWLAWDGHDSCDPFRGGCNVKLLNTTAYWC